MPRAGWILTAWLAAPGLGLRVSTGGQGHVVVRPGEPAVLSCTADTQEAVTCGWILPDGLGECRGRGQCRSAANVRFNGSDTLCQIRVTNVQEEQNGVWTCELGLDGKTTRGEVQLSVERQAEVEWTGGIVSGFTTKLEDGGERREFGCKAQGARPGGSFAFHWGREYSAPDQTGLQLGAPHREEGDLGMVSGNQSVGLVPSLDMDGKTLFCTYLQVDGSGRVVFGTPVSQDITVHALALLPGQVDEWDAKSGENITISVKFTFHPAPREGDLKWGLWIRSSDTVNTEQEIEISKDEERRQSHYIAHPLKEVEGSRYGYEASLTIINVNPSENNNTHSLKMTNRLSSNNAIEKTFTFKVNVDKKTIPAESESSGLTVAIIIIVIVLIVAIIVAVMLVVYAKKNNLWCFSSNGRPYINPDIKEVKEPLQVQHHPYGRPSEK